MDHYWKFVNVDGKPSFRINAFFQEDMVELKIFKNGTAWTSVVSKDELIAHSLNNNSDFAEYYENLKKYIECRPKDVEFDFNDGKFSINLLLKNKMKMLYFYRNLNKAQFEDSIFSLVDALYTKKVEYFNELNDVRNQHAYVKNSYETTERKLKEFLARRKTEELNLYNNFIGILNDKKRQIQHQNDLLIAFRQGRSTVNRPVQVKRKRGNQKPTKNNAKNVKITPETSSDSESDNDHYHTDSDDGTSNGRPVADNYRQENNNLSPIPSTSKMPDVYPHESPSDSLTQPFIFPKRIRSENNLKHCVLPRKQSFEEKEDKETPRSSGNAKNENSVTVNFDTQDLLDNL